MVVMVVLMAACSADNRWDCVTGMGTIQTEVRELPVFHSIYTQNRIDLEYRYASTHRAEVIFGENLLDQILTDVVDGELRLDNMARCNWVRDLSIKPKVVIYAPEFARLENRGNGHIHFVDTLRVDHFEYEDYEANGSVELLLRSNFARIAQHTGRTALVAHGMSDTVGAYSAGSGRLDASGLFSSHTLVNNSSIQPMKVNADGYLFVFIGLRGNVCYSGQPTLIDLDRQGEGNLLPCD